MSEREPACCPSGWTLDTLNTYLSAILDERDRRYRDMLDAAREYAAAATAAAALATAKAEVAAEKRFEAVNEFRSTLADQQANLMTKSEYATAHELLSSRFFDLSSRLDKLEGVTAGLNRGWTYTAVVLTLGLTVIGILVAVFNV